MHNFFLHKNILIFRRFFNSANRLVLLLFVAFIVGFVNEVISGEIEYLMYRLGVPRPSLLILKNVFCRYCVYDISKLKEKLSIDHDE